MNSALNTKRLKDALWQNPYLNFQIFFSNEEPMDLKKNLQI